MFGAILFNNVNCGYIFNENLCYYRFFYVILESNSEFA